MNIPEKDDDNTVHIEAKSMNRAMRAKDTVNSQLNINQIYLNIVRCQETIECESGYVRNRPIRGHTSLQPPMNFCATLNPHSA